MLPRVSLEGLRDISHRIIGASASPRSPVTQRSAIRPQQDKQRCPRDPEACHDNDWVLENIMALAGFFGYHCWLARKRPEPLLMSHLITYGV